MYANGKMMPAETVLGMEGGIDKREMEGINSSMMYLIYCKNFYKCHNVPPPSTIKNFLNTALIIFRLFIY
jgi:hypothetical protein